MVRFLVLMALLTAACGGRDDLDGRRAPVPGLPERKPAYELALGADNAAVYDFVDNRAAASVHVDEALHIDCGSPDFAKYAEGAYRSPWHLGRRVDGVDAALVDGLAGELYFPLDGAPAGVYRGADGGVRLAFYARASEPKQLVSVFLNEHRLRDVSLPTTEWSWYGVEAPASALIDGENKLRFYFKRAAELDGVRTAAAFARIAVGGRRPVPSRELTWPVRGEAVELAGGALDALTADRAGRISFYVAVPATRPALVFALAGQGGASVRVDGDTVWSGTAGADWAAASIDLSSYAGRIARVDFVNDDRAHWGRPQLVAPALAATPARQRPLADHVIVWTVSSWRADRLERRGPQSAIARLAGEGLAFRGFVAAAPAPAPAHVALLTGRFPNEDGIAAGAITLGARFRAAGFGTALISGNGFVNDERGYSQGFDTYLNPMRLRRPHGARVLWQSARKFLSLHKDGRSFVYLASVEPHLPYMPSRAIARPEDAAVARRFEPAQTAEVSEAVRAGRRQLSAEERAWLEALYDDEVHEVDGALAVALADLERLGIADRTAIVLVGDHGEELFERGNFGHGETLHREVLATPLVVWFPAALAPQQIERAVEAVDVFSTALDLAGISANPEAQGVSVLQVGDEAAGPAFSHLPGRGRSMVLGRYKLIVPRIGEHELYDLARDPGERTSLMGTLPTVERYLRNAFGIRVAFEAAWQRRRWGTPDRLAPAFASDHGL